MITSYTNIHVARAPEARVSLDPVNGHVHAVVASEAPGAYAEVRLYGTPTEVLHFIERLEVAVLGAVVQEKVHPADVEIPAEVVFDSEDDDGGLITVNRIRGRRLYPEPVQATLPRRPEHEHPNF